MTGRSTGNDVQPQTGVAPHNEFGHLALLKAAAVAPSGDNTQPWRFEVETSRIRVIVDPARDPSPMNAGQRMARIAAGAAAENIIACQRHNGGEARVVRVQPRIIDHGGNRGAK